VALGAVPCVIEIWRRCSPRLSLLNHDVLTRSLFIKSIFTVNMSEIDPAIETNPLEEEIAKNRAALALRPDGHSEHAISKRANPFFAHVNCPVRLLNVYP
jgi:hypothetical protein